MQRMHHLKNLKLMNAGQTVDVGHLGGIRGQGCIMTFVDKYNWIIF